PAFLHVDETQLPMAAEGVRLILGEWRGAQSPVPTLSAMFYADAQLQPSARVDLDFAYAERAAYVAQGAIECDGRTFDAGQLLVFQPGTSASISTAAKARVLLLGGEPLDGPRFVWWNFVSSRKERIAQAADDWQARRFAAIPGEPEFIPLPGKALRIADYPQLAVTQGSGIGTDWSRLGGSGARTGAA